MRRIEPTSQTKPKAALAPLRANTIASPVGALTLIASERGLAAILWENDDPKRVRLGETRLDAEDAILLEAERELDEYFAGGRVSFATPLDPAGTAFHKTVWAALTAIPYGETLSYGALAARIGMPTGARAVGAAVGRNPLSIMTPCHRAIGADGSLVGFAGGLPAKRLLLDLERRGKQATWAAAPVASAIPSSRAAF